jgi:hypothetical protein
LIRAPLSTTSVLDETSDLVALAAAPWAGLLVMTSLPFRFLQVLFIERLIELGSSATHYGRALGTLANWTTLAFILSLLGRAVWARAVRLAEASAMTEEGRVRVTSAPLRVPLVALMSYLFTGALTEVCFLLSIITIFAVPIPIMMSGLAIGTMELNQQLGLAAPLRLIAKHVKTLRTLIALTIVFALALVIAWINLYAISELLLWLANAFGGVDTSRWSLLLASAHFRFLSLAGAVMIVEPFWIAANVVLVRKAGAQESGEELRLWFGELQGQ